MAGSPVNTQIAGTGIATAGTVAAPFLVSAAMVPVVGAIAALVALAVIKLFSFGPDPNNVPASQIEQTFEYAADLINVGLYQGDYISQQDAIQYCQAMIQAAQSSELQAPQAVKDSKPFKDGSAHAAMVINTYTITGIKRIQPSALAPWNAAAANQRLMDIMSGKVDTSRQGNMNEIGPHHWYPTSVQQGLSIVQGIIAQIDKQNTYNIGGTASPNGVVVGGLSVSKKTADYGLLAAGALILWEVI